MLKGRNVEGVLTGFIRVVVVGPLLFLRGGRLLAGRRGTEGGRLPPLVSPSGRSHLLRRSGGRGKSSICCKQKTTQLKWLRVLGREVLARLCAPCWAAVADTVGGGLELWTGTIFFITTGLLSPWRAPPVAMPGKEGLGATRG